MIGAAAFDFLRGLAANNDRAWFEANRATYESAVRQPMAALVGAVTTELTRRSLPLDGDPKRSLFRINRDTRFSRSKTPYKTNAAAVWFRQGGSKDSPGTLYLHIEADACFVGAAFRLPEPDVLDSIRERIRVHPDRFDAVLHSLAQAKLSLIDAERLTRMPKGFEDLRGTPHDPALRLRSFIVRRPLSTRAVQSRTLPARIADLAEHALPLLRFGWDAIDETAHA